MEDSLEKLFYDLLKEWEENERFANNENSLNGAEADEAEVVAKKSSFIERFNTLIEKE